MPNSFYFVTANLAEAVSNGDVRNGLATACQHLPVRAGDEDVTYVATLVREH